MSDPAAPADRVEGPPQAPAAEAPTPPPAAEPPAPAPRQARQAPRRARWLDRLSIVVVVVAAAGALGAGVPSLLRAAGVEMPGADPSPSVLRSVASAAPTAARGTTAAPHPSIYGVDENPRFAPEDDEPRVTELERMYPDGMWPSHRGREPRASRGATETPAQPRMAHARSPLVVHERADVASPTTGEVPAGGSVMIIREAGEWTLVVYQRPEGVTIGWAKRGGISMP